MQGVIDVNFDSTHILDVRWLQQGNSNTGRKAKQGRKRGLDALLDFSGTSTLAAVLQSNEVSSLFFHCDVLSSMDRPLRMPGNGCSGLAHSPTISSYTAPNLRDSIRLYFDYSAGLSWTRHIILTYTYDESKLRS